MVTKLDAGRDHDVLQEFTQGLKVMKKGLFDEAIFLHAMRFDVAFDLLATSLK